jgi:CRISPR-associated protein Cas7/Cst2/DevR subtype I-B
MENSSKINSITCTVIFDGSALNRDEKIGNSILSIKKLTYHGDIRPFISKNAIRHYLFNTLNRYADWGKTPILAQGSGDKQTMQLNLTEADIISFEELAVFGYMFTKSGGALTRKAPLGITKAIAMSNYNQDLAFYANHDFVHRMQDAGKKANPNPINKEEHSGLFKLTFTLDADIIGKDSWVVDEYSFKGNELNIKIQEPQRFMFENCKKEEDEDGNLIGYMIELENKDKTKDNLLIKVNGFLVTLPDDKRILSYSKDKKLLTLKADLNLLNKNQKKKMKFNVEEPFTNEEEKEYSFECTYDPNSKYDDDAKTLTLELGYEKKIENVQCENDYLLSNRINTFMLINEKYEDCKIVAESLDTNKPQNGPFRIKFILSEIKKKKIMQQVLFVIKNGLMAQSSNELNTIKPLFILAGDVKIPMPVFHADIDVKKENGELKVVGVKDAIDNDWIAGNIYLQCNERLSMSPVNDERIKNDWKVFLSSIKLGEDEIPAN